MQKWLTLSACAALFTAGQEREASACGGFFCSQTQTVNQAAERIIFSDNGDGTVTAVIQILYDGPSENFSWLLPISSVPAELKVSSEIAFQRLQNATNPQYNLQRVVEGECARERFDGSAGGAAVPSGGAGESGEGGSDGGGVVVAASGVVGPFAWEAISVDSSLPDVTDVAVNWLTEHGYDVPEGTPGVLRPYLEDGLYLLALRLTKGSDSGSIRPIVVTYEATRPSIPVRPTAVAANADMGVMTWVLSSARAVPQNYRALELNEARLNWFSPNSNYNQIVIAAADESGGQGFVTELAQDTSRFEGTIWSEFDADNWQRLQENPTDYYAFSDAYYQFGAWDGFWETVEATLTAPDGVTWDYVRECPYCVDLREISLVDTQFVSALETNVIEPVRLVQELIGTRPFMTRLYTTLSAEEMTVDPLFTFNPELGEVDNVHSATQVIECGPTFYEREAPWRIELPNGSVVRGVGSDRSWPESFADQPANARILQLGESGDGRVLEDNAPAIEESIDAYNASVPIAVGTAAAGGEAGDGPAPARGGAFNGTGGSGGAARGGSAGAGATGGAGAGRGGSGPSEAGEGGVGGSAGNPGELEESGCVCAVRPRGTGRGLGFAPLVIAGLALALRRQRRGARGGGGAAVRPSSGQGWRG